MTYLFKSNYLVTNMEKKESRLQIFLWRFLTNDTIYICYV